MLSPNGIHSNGHSTNGYAMPHMLECESDYPAIDVMAYPAKQGSWRDALAPYTHSLSWSNGDCTHSLTIRSDSLEALLADLKLVRQGIRRAKEKRATANPEAKGAVCPWC
jgi:hypothetical protein